MQDPRARRSRRDPGAAGRRPTRPVPRLLRRPRPPRRCRCRPRGPGADAVCPAPESQARAGAAWSPRPRADVPLSDLPGPDPKPLWRAGFPAGAGWSVPLRAGAGTPGSACAGCSRARERDSPGRPRRRPERRSGPRTQRRCEPGSCALADGAHGRSALTGWVVVVVVRRGPWAERLLARGLPAEAGSTPGRAWLRPGRRLPPPSPRERARWRRGPGRGLGACGWAGRARRASAPTPAERPSRDGFVHGRPVFAGPQQGCVARVPGGRQAGVARPRPQGGEAWRARSSPLAGKAGGARPPGCGRVAQAGRRRGRGRQGAGRRGSGRGRTWKQGCESELAVQQAEVAAPAKRGGLATRRGAACVGADGVGRGGALRVGGWARVREAQAGRPEKQQLQPQTPGEERCAEKD